MLAGLGRELRRVWSQLHKAALRLRLGQSWSDGDGLGRRRYPDYETYLTHQRLKHDATRRGSLAHHADRFHAALSERLLSCPMELEGRSVLCLGAREGAEVRAFIDRGAFAIGVDLNPGPANPWVVPGDFHRLRYGDRSVDVVYTNSIDHVFELERMVGEVKRVLKPGGLFLIEVGLGTEEGGGRGFYEALSWTRADELVARVVAAGFAVERRIEFQIPWRGVQAALRKAGD
jgi:SAM-dependent methyltransferase